MQKPISMIWLFLVGLLVATSGWSLTEGEVEERVRELSYELRCPTCQGLSVQESEAGFSVQMRNKVEEMVRLGKTNDEIKEYFVARYGEWILRSPPKVGFNLLLWVLPGLFVLGAFWFIYQKIRAWNLELAKGTTQPEPLSEEEQKMLEKDLKRFEQDS